MRRDTPLRSPLALVAVVGIAVLASGCRDGPRAAAPTAGEEPVVSTLVPAPEPSAPEPGQGFELVPVRFGRIELRVPAGWPVHDLDREPRTCVRWDSPAVYLGTPSADQECPAMAVGNEGGILVEPLGPASAPLPGERVTPGRIAGHPAYFDGDPALTGRVVARIPDLNTRVVVATGGSKSFGDRIISTIREISVSPTTSSQSAGG